MSGQYKISDFSWHISDIKSRLNVADEKNKVFRDAVKEQQTRVEKQIDSLQEAISAQELNIVNIRDWLISKYPDDGNTIKYATVQEFINMKKAEADKAEAAENAAAENAAAEKAVATGMPENQKTINNGSITANKSKLFGLFGGYKKQKASSKRITTNRRTNRRTKKRR